jgi:mRNA-degrading endonuclease toxin of MazEF toxin-antitoxin module
MDLKQGDVVLVPYPYVPRPKTARRANDPGLPEIDQVRPAVIVSGRKLRDDSERVFLVMITKATRPALPGDMVIADLASAGLNVESRVRPTKIATLPTDAIIKRLGSLNLSETEVVVARVRQFLVR